MNDDLIKDFVKLYESLIEAGEQATVSVTALTRMGAPEGFDACIERLRLELPDWTVKPMGRDVYFVRHV